MPCDCAEAFAEGGFGGFTLVLRWHIKERFKAVLAGLRWSWLQADPAVGC